MKYLGIIAKRIVLCVIAISYFNSFQILKSQSDNSLETSLYKDLPFKMNRIIRPVFPDYTVSITDFGAVADGITSNTKSINAAIEAVAKKGGGTVIIPEGLWLTGPIVFKDNICLKTEKGALIRFTSDYNEYPLIRTTYEGSNTWRAMSPLFADGLKNIAIIGDGIFDGNGNAWRPIKKFKVVDSRWKKLLASGGYLSADKTFWYPTESALIGNTTKPDVSKMTEQEVERVKGFLRPVLLNFYNCKNILIENVIFQNPPAWTLHPELCESIIISNVKVYNEEWQTNADALDLESCKNALIYNCVFNAGDDAICMKSGRDEEGRKRGIPTENVIINNCKVYRGHGGFVVGSEMSGGVRNIKVSHCTFMGTNCGLRFKSSRGRGGIVENIFINDINMLDIEGDAILYDLYYASKKNAIVPTVADETTPVFRNIFMNNINCKGAERAILFQGLPEMNLQNVSLINSVIEAKTGIFCYDANGIIMKNIQVITPQLPVVTINNAKGISIENFKTKADSAEFILIEGKSENLTFIKGVALSNIKFADGIDKNVVKIKN
jgi:polygalacturonase